MKIITDNLTGPEIAALLQEHLDDMYATSPPESVHALDLNKLRQPEITFWSIWENNNLAGCIAVKQLDATHGEIKSMRTAKGFHRKGIASTLVEHVIKEAQQRQYQRLSLETGTQDYFEPARRLYLKFGFTECGPFDQYQLDPNSVFYTLKI